MAGIGFCVRTKHIFYLSLLVLFGSVAANSSLSAYDLMDYVKASDNSYRWTKTDELKQPFGDRVVFDMTSQTWQGIAWKHKVDLFIPSSCEFPDTAVLIVAGGSGENELAWILTGMAKCPVAVLHNIPNQPLYDNLYEDSLIAYTFAKAMDTDDLTWPLLLPMTKSAVRAMDLLQAYSGQKMQKKFSRFVVGGASKRGWTTWLTAAADPARVKGIIPIVYDNLDLERQMELQRAAYGEYSKEISEYTDIKLQEKLNTPKGRQLAKIVDPWTYINKITMPKLIINGANDPYWNIASMNIYWDSLKGKKSVVYIPNAGHDLGLSGKDMSGAISVLGPMTAFIRNVAKTNSFAPMNWKYASSKNKCSLKIKTTSKDTSAKMWIAVSDTRDFRQSRWEPVDMKPVKTGFNGVAELPKTGYMAIFGEVKYPGTPAYSLSTQVGVFNSKGAVPVLTARK